MCIRFETREKARRRLAFSPVSKPPTQITYMLRVYNYTYLTYTIIHIWRIQLWIPGVYDNSCLAYAIMDTLKSPVIVKNKTFWTSVGHVKMTFSLLLEDISKTYESFECFLPDVGYYLWQNPTIDQINSFTFNILPKLIKFDLERKVASFDVILFPF